MGLDMFAFSVPAETVGDRQVDIAQPEGSQPKLIAQWRKHPNLHGWMEALYRSKGGTSEHFNCDTVRLTAADVDALEAAVVGGKLPDTSGFFFGQSTEEDTPLDLKFIAAARQELAAGNAVIYDSWW